MENDIGMREWVKDTNSTKTQGYEIKSKKKKLNRR